MNATKHTKSFSRNMKNTINENAHTYKTHTRWTQKTTLSYFVHIFAKY